MQMKLKVTVAAAIAAAAGVALAQDMVVKIGHVAPISGAQAAYGKDNENGARMAIEDLNAAGVTIGGTKVKFELVAEDDAAASAPGGELRPQPRLSPLVQCPRDGETLVELAVHRSQRLDRLSILRCRLPPRA